MVSENKLIANRENARLGGVKTKEGKAITRLNAVTHGLLSKEALLPGEDGETLNKITENLMAELEPHGELETILVDRMISSFWRLRRALIAEKNFIIEGLRDRTSDPGIRKIDAAHWYGIVTSNFLSSTAWHNLNRYETSIERQFYKAVHELQRLPMARLGQKLSAPIAIDIDVSKEE